MSVPQVHVLYRVNWQRSRGEHGEFVLRLPGSTRIRSFDDADEARRECQAREREARSQVNPFLCGGNALHYQTEARTPAGP